MEHVAGVGNTRTVCRILVGKDRLLLHLNADWRIILKQILTHCGPVTEICVFTLQLCKTDDANLRF